MFDKVDRRIQRALQQDARAIDQRIDTQMLLRRPHGRVIFFGGGIQLESETILPAGKTFAKNTQYLSQYILRELARSFKRYGEFYVWVAICHDLARKQKRCILSKILICDSEDVWRGAKWSPWTSFIRAR